MSYCKIVNSNNKYNGMVSQVPLSESIFFGGVLAGALVFGQLGDSLGRSVLCHILFHYFSSNLSLFTVE